MGYVGVTEGCSKMTGLNWIEESDASAKIRVVVSVSTFSTTQKALLETFEAGSKMKGLSSIVALTNGIGHQSPSLACNCASVRKYD